MKKQILLLILTTLAVSGCSKRNEIKPEMIDASRKISMEFMSNLKNLVFSKISEGGVLNAVSVCSDTALVYTKHYSEYKGIEIRRITFKNRNPRNIPDEFESKVLKIFERQKAEGKLNKDSEYAEITETEGGKVFRYMKPISVSADCLTCHGNSSEIPGEVQLLIKEKYPTDKARDYKAGDLRGAVSIIKPL